MAIALFNRSRNVRHATPVYVTNAPAPVKFKLTIIVPAYNEERFVSEVMERLLGIEIPGQAEIIAVNDGSTDSTGEVLEKMSDPRLVVLHHEQNRGKGAAVRSGIKAATGSHILIFDADTEYDVHDIPRLVAPILTGRAEVVYGSRMSGFGTVHPSRRHSVGNHAMTSMANIIFGSAISDLHTCLKLFPVPLLESFELTETGFGLDTEISAEMLRSGFRPFEVPISYVARSAEEGKKIRTRDAFRCVYVLLKVRLRGTVTYGQRNRALAPRSATDLNSRKEA